MKKLLAALALLVALSVPSHAATRIMSIGNNTPNLTVDAIASIGGTSNLITLMLDPNSGAGLYSSFRTVLSTNTAYQVTAGKTLYVIDCEQHFASTAAILAEIDVSTYSVVNGASLPSGGVISLGLTPTTAPTANTMGYTPLWWTILAGNFLSAKTPAANKPVAVYCHAFEQ